MWNRFELKERAKEILKLHYWKMLLVSFIMSIVGADFGGNKFSLKESFNKKGIPFWEQSYFQMPIHEWTTTLFLIVGSLFFVTLVFILLRLLVGYGIDVGGKRYYILLSMGREDLNQLGFAFKKDRYMKIFITQLRKDAQLFLWTLLFVIPGIVKSYSYFLVPFILAENPAIGSGRAIELSRSLMDGHKFDAFVLQLSFLGWYLLGVMALFIGVIFVTPYVRATEVELYLVLKAAGIAKGITNHQEFIYEAY